ncbi:hypothetical protein A3H75_02595 [Candidatus Uhrbacteria bacterium RIFCSPLOWO2_02_FULL_51_9]|uniref:Uncharacterized protein n=1 Tax=Candidatus Uhrbacteria bacterium RIFCSPLOWO2_02_FULL_51_9 TaxID=1802410 RepID=A0A1F7VD80_9BACT|nr:MAG: hypothetical protein A3H75_02595 [Candidatus Uhrbacteria bacterium RIFCSPLOWO2_02_FULL_51_9]
MIKKPIPTKELYKAVSRSSRLEGLSWNRAKKNRWVIKKLRHARQLDPGKPAQRKQIIEAAVKRTIAEYGEALQRLSAE